MSTRKYLDTLLLFGFIRKRQQKYKSLIPIDIINLCFTFYHLTFEILSFSTKFKSNDGLQLSDINRCVKRVATGTSTVVFAAHRYILVADDPVFEGKHCWRFQTINPNKGWIMWGVSKPGKFTNYSYDFAFGIASANRQYFPWDHALKANVKHNNISMTHFFMKKGEVDVLFDVDKRELKICVVGQCNEWKEAKIWNIRYPEDEKYGWVPHINLHALQTEVRIAKIPLEWYGQNDDNIFHQVGHKTVHKIIKC